MMRFCYMSGLEGKSQEEIRKLQEERLPKQLKYCYDHSEFYKMKFDACGARPEDIRTLEDLRKLPVFMVKDDERRSAEQSLQKYGHPFGLHLCAPLEDLYLTGTTSGTTGTPTFSYTFTENDMNFLAPRIAHRLSLAGVGKGDRVAFFFALGIYATTMTLWGLRLLGALPIDIDARGGTRFRRGGLPAHSGPGFIGPFLFGFFSRSARVPPPAFWSPPEFRHYGSRNPHTPAFHRWKAGI